jgi:HD-like signal output (HDOD) protein
VRHGAEAALELRRESCDLILLDNQVPMGGVKTARILRLHPKFNTIPIILGLPANKDEARKVIAESNEIGVSNFLLKPFTMAALKKKMDDVLGDETPVEKPTFMEIRDELRNLSNLPAMPEAHSKLLTLLSKSDGEVDMNAVAKTLEMDAAMSAKVMRTCRSAFFGFQGSMMKQAVAFLGVAVIRQIVQSAVVVNMFEDEKEGESKLSMQDLWRHSMATGLAMEVIGKADKKKTHFLLGVLHDVGKAVFKFRFPEHFASVMDLVEKEGVSMYTAEQELLGITHAECGGELAVHWDLPGEVRTAIAAHHTPAETTQHKRLAAMVHIADIAVRTMKIGYGGDELIPAMDPYAARLQKSVEEITAQRDEITGQIDAMIGGSDQEEEN